MHPERKGEPLALSLLEYSEPDHWNGQGLPTNIDEVRAGMNFKYHSWVQMRNERRWPGVTAHIDVTLADQCKIMGETIKARMPDKIFMAQASMVLPMRHTAFTIHYEGEEPTTLAHLRSKQQTTAGFSCIPVEACTSFARSLYAANREHIEKPLTWANWAN